MLTILREKEIMANHKSAKKRIRQTEKRRVIKKSIKSGLRSLEKDLRQSIEKKDKNQALKQLQILTAKLDRSVHKGIEHKNRVSRKKSRLTKLIEA